MSPENVESFYRAHDAFNGRNVDALIALCDPEVEYFSTLVELEGGPWRGHDGVRDWWENLLRVFPDFRTEVDEVRDLGDVTVARVRLRGHGMQSEALTHGTQWQVTEWRNRKAIRIRAFTSEAEALEAPGLSE